MRIVTSLSMDDWLVWFSMLALRRRQGVPVGVARGHRAGVSRREPSGPSSARGNECTSTGCSSAVDERADEQGDTGCHWLSATDASAPCITRVSRRRRAVRSGEQSMLTPRPVRRPADSRQPRILARDRLAGALKGSPRTCARCADAARRSSTGPPFACSTCR